MKEDKCSTPTLTTRPEAKPEEARPEQKPKEHLIYNQNHEQIEKATSQAVIQATKQANLKVYI